MKRSTPSRRTADPILEELRLLVRHVTRLSGAVDEEPELTTTQRLALATVGDEAPLRVGDLADRLGVTPPTASRALDVLAELGLVTRVADPSDRRALLVEPTAGGKRLLAERRARAAAAFAPAAARLRPQERDQLTALLERLRSELERTAS